MPQILPHSAGTEPPLHHSTISEEKSYLRQVVVQFVALMYVKFLLALRNKATTAMRLLSPLIFTLLIYVVNIGLKSRFAADPIYLDLKSPTDSWIGPIPDCESPDCINFAYVPAPHDGYVPGADFPTMSDFVDSFSSSPNSVPTCAVSAVGAACRRAVCDGPAVEAACEPLCEAWRVHRVVRGVMRNNRGVGGRPIPAPTTLGFCNATGLDQHLLARPGAVQGALLFSSAGDNRTTFAVVTNSTPYLVRGAYARPLLEVALPMQVAATRELARQLVFADEGLDVALATRPFAHPPLASVRSFESLVAPLFILGSLMFPFVVQVPPPSPLPHPPAPPTARAAGV
jgi:hypothetical protein